MKKFFFMAAAVMASASMNAQFLKFEGIATEVETEAKAVAAGTSLGSNDALAAAVAFDDNYKTVNLKHQGYGWWEIDGANVNAPADTLGLQGATNPTDVDGKNPALTTTQVTKGAVFEATPKADGWLYIFHKASSHKQYMVEIAGYPVGYHFGMITTDANGYFGEVGATKVIEYTIEGNEAETGIINDDRKIEFAEDYAKGADHADFGTATYKQNGLGVIAVRCFANTPVWFHATGSKMSAIGVAYYPVEKDVFVVNEDGSKVQIYTAAPSEGIENTNSAAVKATKVIENGQVVIIRGDVRYNALGTVIE